MYLSKGVLIVLPDSTVDPDKLAGCGIERSSKGFELSRLYHISTSHASPWSGHQAPTGNIEFSSSTDRVLACPLGGLRPLDVDISNLSNYHEFMTAGTCGMESVTRSA